MYPGEKIQYLTSKIFQIEIEFFQQNLHECSDGRDRPHSIMDATLPTPSSKVDEHKQLVMSCTRCMQLILLQPDVYDSTAEEHVIYTDHTQSVKPQDICKGPKNSILAVNALVGSKSVCHYRWKGDKMVLRRQIPIATDFPPHIVYDEQNNLVIVSKWTGDVDIFAYDLKTRRECWRFGDENRKKIEGVEIKPCGLALDPIGRLYVADGSNSRVLVIDSATGKFHQCLNLPHLGTIRDISWGDMHAMYPEQRMLTVMHTTQQEVLGVTHFAICPDS